MAWDENTQIRNNFNNLDPEWLVAVSLGQIPGYTWLEKFGQSPSISSGAGFITLWDGGGEYVPPTQPRIHDVASDSDEDAGILVAAGTSTYSAKNILRDSGADFVTAGVQVGDLILVDGYGFGTRVLSVASPTSLLVYGWLNVSNGTRMLNIPDGAPYRIVRPVATGASVYFIQGLGADGLPQLEFVITNGTTPVPTMYEWIRQ